MRDLFLNCRIEISILDAIGGRYLCSLLVVYVLTAKIRPKCSDDAQQSQAATPSTPAGDGRIYIYRVNSPLGARVQPAIKVNGEKVSDAVPNGFVFVDRPAGNYEISTSTEVERTLSLTFAANETKYVRLGISMGFFVGHVYPELVEPIKGEAELKTLHHLTSE